MTSSTVPQRNKFSMTRQQVIDDIEAVYRVEDQRSKLYWCLDERPPRETKFERIEEFLKGTQDLEKSSNILNNLKHEMEALQKDIASQIATIRETSANALRS
ncbi:hypothetical protein TcasGA2_TC010430 [Tribolium castaneum]|uniref:Uncharacterized protein n=1 Tax=Tribolium castaneum TaxID=7070 RepID=D6WKM6_TRICA|nr:PREDICTED: uncharacterized protein LOC103314920 [Tribolium castaneum]EFA03007.1 hypothetical protein TcasGA2_TC010430 [Tribolium castaneum]|eukprot:XP_008200436.1 PREDICTED: uncharacterized protein LOC103314920 [Tribolium castaneum]